MENLAKQSRNPTSKEDHTCQNCNVKEGDGVSKNTRKENPPEHMEKTNLMKMSKLNFIEQGGPELPT